MINIAIVLDKEDIKTITNGNRVGIKTDNFTILFTPEAMKEFKQDIAQLDYDEHNNIVMPEFIKKLSDEQN